MSEPAPVPNARWLPLTKEAWALVDEEDYAAMSRWKWSLSSGGYAKRTENRKEVRMHDQLLGLKGVDHVDGNGLNNRKKNLRAASHQNNMRNRKTPSNNKSGYKGVYWHRAAQKWQAGLREGSRYVYLGLFDTPEAAAHAYDAEAKRRFGEFAKLNFPETA